MASSRASAGAMSATPGVEGVAHDDDANAAAGGEFEGQFPHPRTDESLNLEKPARDGVEPLPDRQGEGFLLVRAELCPGPGEVRSGYREVVQRAGDAGIRLRGDPHGHRAPTALAPRGVEQHLAGHGEQLWACVVDRNLAQAAPGHGIHLGGDVVAVVIPYTPARERQHIGMGRRIQTAETLLGARRHTPTCPASAGV